MNREIKFRAIRADNGEWVYGDLEHNPAKDITRIHTYDTDGNYEGQHIVTPESVCQFTGLRDNNGQEIYEGDILGFPKDNYFLPETIIFREGCFIAKDDCIDTAMCEIDTDYRIIIGNIYDNPELVKKDYNEI